ncbi:glycosyltransferase family 4 protein [Chengkuizengella sediminis]|uniref:glycosyltransferase family 4 protein n=1 Tax=Chengkuizengella sediminis TaxID=1885917 RepID=UPI0013894697|nr:glycosyltransferase family 4 protein [Chengkuizengella sediminis]NDI34883.1 glycosyltransferase family 4 protein [Chengkuizengella sediminis]
MKVIYLTAEGFDTPNPNNQLAMTMIDDFLNAGIEVHMISSRRKAINPDIPDILKDRNGFTVDIIDRPVVDKSHFVTRYLEETLYSFKAMSKWLKIRKNIDMVLVQSCPTVLSPMFLLKFLLRKPIIYSIFDVFPGSANDIGVIRNKNVYNILAILQKFVYKFSDKVVVISSDMKKKVTEEKVDEEKIRVIPNWYDENSVIEIDSSKNKFIQKYNIDTNKFYVQFAGTLGYVFDYKMVLDVAERLKGETNIVFQMIGDGNIKKQFMNETEERGLSNIVFYPLQPLEIVPDVYSACSLCFIPLKKGVIGNGVPSKAYLLMACRRVVLNSVEEDSDYYKMFNDNNIGVSVPNSDPVKVAEKIQYLYNNQEKLLIMAENAKRFGEKHYTRKVNTQKFISLFNEIYHREGRS